MVPVLGFIVANFIPCRKLWIFGDPEGRGIRFVLVLQVIQDVNSKALARYLLSCIIRLDLHISIVNVNLWISDDILIALGKIAHVENLVSHFTTVDILGIFSWQLNHSC